MLLEPRPYVRAAFDRKEKIYLLKAGLLILAIYLFRSIISRLIALFLFLLPLLFYAFVWERSIRKGERIRDILRDYVTMIPLSHAEGGKKNFIPWVTLWLVLINAFFYYVLYVLPDSALLFLIRNFMFLPIDITWWNILPSVVTSMFLHAGAAHLWGNMAFLWAFAPSVEERLGRKKFAIIYLATGVAGNLIAAYMHLVTKQQFILVLGASGAIAGIMGVFMVRCYFKRLVVPVPIFGLVYVKIKVHSLLPLGFFFLRDLRGGIRDLMGYRSGIGYWAHIGSMLAGMLIAARLKLHREAVEEHYTEEGKSLANGEMSGLQSHEAFQAALQLNPDNEEALAGLAREYARSRRPEGRDLYGRAIALALRSGPARAAELYTEYMESYNRMLDPELQYRLAALFHRRGEFEPAARSLEMIVLEPSANDATRQRAFHQLILLLAANNMLEAADYRLRQFREQFPDSELVQAAEDAFVEILKK